MPERVSERMPERWPERMSDDGRNECRTMAGTNVGRWPERMSDDGRNECRTMAGTNVGRRSERCRMTTGKLVEAHALRRSRLESSRGCQGIAALGSAALDTLGFQGAGRPTETSIARADEPSVHRAQPPGRCPGPRGLPPVRANSVSRCHLQARLKLDDGKPRRETVARLPVLVDADDFDKPVLHQIVERFEVLLVGFAHAAIVAGAGHQIMIARPPTSAPDATRGCRPRGQCYTLIMQEATPETPSAAPLKGDPFFAQLKADIEEGVAAADRGELFTVEEARERARKTLLEIQRTAF
jgi:hypothetical protein